MNTDRKLITTNETEAAGHSRQLNLKNNMNKVAHYDDKSSTNTRRQLSG